HLALVENKGVATLYTNGVAAGSVTNYPNPPNSSFAIGANVGGGNGFTGLIDEVRIFTFPPGLFSPNFLLLNPPNNVPTFANVIATNVGTSGGATLTALVTPNAPSGQTSQVWFGYGLTTNYGSFTATNTIASGAASGVADVVIGLQ